MSTNRSRHIPLTLCKRDLVRVLVDHLPIQHRHVAAGDGGQKAGQKAIEGRFLAEKVGVEGLAFDRLTRSVGIVRLRRE